MTGTSCRMNTEGFRSFTGGKTMTCPSRGGGRPTKSTNLYFYRHEDAVAMCLSRQPDLYSQPEASLKAVRLTNLSAGRIIGATFRSGRRPNQPAKPGKVVRESDVVLLTGTTKRKASTSLAEVFFRQKNVRQTHEVFSLSLRRLHAYK
jgi:hypothetical protein